MGTMTAGSRHPPALPPPRFPEAKTPNATMTTRTHFTFLLASASFTLSAASQELKQDRRQGAAAVTAEQCSEWLHTLAGPDFAGSQSWSCP